MFVQRAVAVQSPTSRKRQLAPADEGVWVIDGVTAPRAAIVGIAGPVLFAEEAALFRALPAVRRDSFRPQHSGSGAAGRTDGVAASLLRPKPR